MLATTAGTANLCPELRGRTLERYERRGAGQNAHGVEERWYDETRERVVTRKAKAVPKVVRKPSSNTVCMTASSGVVHE
jgi:hypothetical protein